MASSAPPLLRSRRLRLSPAQLRGWGPSLVVASALLFLAWCTLSAIERPGLQYDEALFVNASLGGHAVNGAFVADRFLGVPTMVMPYAGALKSWLYAPLFELFGVSVSTIRVPAIALLAATVLLAFASARRVLGAWPAALLALLMATDPVFMTMAKADWGPVVLSALLRVAALAAYVAWARTASVRYLWLLAVAIVLGIFNKVDFLAFAVPLAFVAAALDHRGIVARVRARRWAAVLPLGALAGVLLLEYVEIYRPARDYPAPRSDAGLLDRVSEVWRLLHATMDGTSIYAYMTARPLGHGTASAAVGLLSVALAAGLAAWRLLRLRRPLDATLVPLGRAAQVTTFALLLLLASTALLVATPEAVGPHHAMLVWPLPALLGACLVSAALRVPGARARSVATVAVCLPLLWLAATQVRVAETYRADFAHGRFWSSIWTPEIYAVVDAVRRAAPGVDRVVTTDWGFGNQLLSLGGSPVRNRLDDAWGTFAGGDPAAIDQLAAASLRGRRTVVVAHQPDAEIMPGTYAAARGMLRRLRPAHGVATLYRGSAELAWIVDDRPRQ